MGERKFWAPWQPREDAAADGWSHRPLRWDVANRKVYLVPEAVLDLSRGESGLQ